MLVGMDRVRTALVALLVAMALALGGCASDGADRAQQDQQSAAPSQEQTQEQSATDGSQSASSDVAAPTSFNLASVSAYDGAPSVEVNGNVPFFTADDIAYAEANPGFERYSDQDDLARCGVAMACIGPETMPAKGEERGSIGMIKPSGWHVATYDFVDGRYLYNRCHLLGWQLSAENDNLYNLITGTRAMNADGMLPYENQVNDYVDATGNHVLYRVTPVFVDDELVARGVLMEARSVEDDGAGLAFNVWCYNAQPGVAIDYVDGNSWEDASVGASVNNGAAAAGGEAATAPAEEQVSESVALAEAAQSDYVLNTNSMKFHRPTCASIEKMSAKNRQDFHGIRDDVIAQGYDPCKNCNP